MAPAGNHLFRFQTNLFLVKNLFHVGGKGILVCPTAAHSWTEISGYRLKCVYFTGQWGTQSWSGSSSPWLLNFSLLTWTNDLISRVKTELGKSSSFSSCSCTVTLVSQCLCVLPCVHLSPLCLLFLVPVSDLHYIFFFLTQTIWSQLILCHKRILNTAVETCRTFWGNDDGQLCYKTVTDNSELM